MIVTVEPWRAGRGHLSLGTIILGGGGHLSPGIMICKCRTRTIVSRNNNSNCRTRGGGGGHLCLFKCRTRETGSFVSRNNDSTCRTSHFSLEITILSVESER